jgi:hypothetical protein
MAPRSPSRSPPRQSQASSTKAAEDWSTFVEFRISPRGEVAALSIEGLFGDKIEGTRKP